MGTMITYKILVSKPEETTWKT